MRTDEGKGVLSGKVFEYLAAGRPILAVVPPDGAAAELIRETRAGTVVAPNDVDGIRTALEHSKVVPRRWPRERRALERGSATRLSRRARVEETAALLRSIA